MAKWITKIVQPTTTDAMVKPKSDVVKVANQMGYHTLYIRMNADLTIDANAMTTFKGLVEGVMKDDTVVYQYPSYAGESFDLLLVSLLVKRGCHVAIFAHDVESIRFAEPQPVEIGMFNLADVLIVHNAAMEQGVRNLGIKVPIVQNQIFDYLIDEDSEIALTNSQVDRELVIAGNLRKSSFIQNWDKKIRLQAFGNNPGPNIGETVQYRGSYVPQELLFQLPTNGIGLAWDVNLRAKYGEYTRFNSPHKVSLFLSRGMPVVVWNQAGIAPFILNNQLGFGIDTLDQIDDFFENLSAMDLALVKNNVLKLSPLLREGFFTQTVLLKVEQIINLGRIIY